MSRVAWDQVGQRTYETGVDHGVLYIPDNAGVYSNGYAWSGLTTVTESPSGAESNKQYADNIVYLNLLSVEEFNATIEAFTYPKEFEQCDGVAGPTPGVTVGQQSRKLFGLCYRTLKGNDVDGNDYGYKLHLVYGALAAPSEKAYGTVNDSPEAINFSWDISTTPVEVPGFKPSASLTIDSTEVDADALANLEDLLYGTEGTDPSLPLPADVFALFTGTVTEVTPVQPTFDGPTNTITIPTTTGVDYKIGGVKKTGTVVITSNTIVSASPQPGFVFVEPSDSDWYFPYTAG